MSVYWIIYAFTFLLALFSIVARGHAGANAYLRYGTAILFLSLVLFAGLRGAFVDPDMINYINWFSWLDLNYENQLESVRDPIFALSALSFLRTGFAISFYFLAIAAISIVVKWRFFRLSEYEEFTPLVIYLYFCRFYFIHDMTQIRAGLGIAFASLAIVLLYRRRTFQGISTFAIATGVHLVSALMGPLALFVLFNRQFAARWPLLLMFAAALLLSGRINDLIGALGLYEFSRTSSYLDGSYEVNENTLFSVYFIVKVTIFTSIAGVYWTKAGLWERIVLYLVATGICLQIAFVRLDVFSLRASEVFGIFDLIMFVIPLRQLTRLQSITYSFMLLGIGLIFFMSSLGIMRPYQLSNFW